MSIRPKKRGRLLDVLSTGLVTALAVTCVPDRPGDQFFRLAAIPYSRLPRLPRLALRVATLSLRVKPPRSLKVVAILTALSWRRGPAANRDDFGSLLRKLDGFETMNFVTLSHGR